MMVLISREEITPDDYGPVVSIVTWVLLASLVHFVSAKVAIKVIACRTFDSDDAVLLTAMVIMFSSPFYQTQGLDHTRQRKLSVERVARYFTLLGRPCRRGLY